MKIWMAEVDIEANTSRGYFATKRLAAAWIDEHFEDAEPDECRLKQIEIKPTRRGIAAALNSLLDTYCVNEH